VEAARDSRREKGELMAKDFEHEYKDATIRYSLDMDIWEVTEGLCKDYGNQRLSKVYAHIDRKLKAEQKRNPIPAFWREWNTLEEGVVTSFDDNPNYCWVKNSQDRRSKRPVNTVFLDTPENRVALEKIRKLEESMGQIRWQIDDIWAEMMLITGKQRGEI
jgi:hypothetical protein